MQIMHSYSDILSEIELIKTQLEITNSEIEYWYLDGGGANKFGANASLIQVEKLVQSRNKLFDRLQVLEESEKRVAILIQRFEGIEYKIAYKRIVEGKTHQEIAIELGYEEQTIRKRWSRMKCHKEATYNTLKV